MFSESKPSLLTPSPKLHFAICEEIPKAQEDGKRFLASFDQTPEKEADLFVVLGGDGFMLHTLHRLLKYQKPLYGLNYGRVGFLMNTPCHEEKLLKRLQQAQHTKVNLLKMEATTVSGHQHQAWAFNEISMFRETYQAAKLSLSVNGVVRLQELISDGVLVATPAGSTAYNLSSNGPILPIGSNVLALTPLSPFRPRRWRGAILPHDVVIDIEVLDPLKRPVSAVADDQEVAHLQTLSVFEDPQVSIVLLFDPQHNLEERILAEQFYGV